MWKLCNTVNTQGHEIPSDNYHSSHIGESLFYMCRLMYYFTILCDLKASKFRGYPRNSKTIEKPIKYQLPNFIVDSNISLKINRK